MNTSNTSLRSLTPVPQDTQNPTPAKDGSSSRHPWADELGKRYPIVNVLREDRHRNGGIRTPGFQTIACHRLANWAESDEAPKALRAPVGRMARAGLLVARGVYGIELPASVVLGRRVKVAHQSGIIVHPDVVIGDDVLIRQNVTIGLREDIQGDASEHVPRIRSGASLGAGAVVVGPVVVGEGAVIGANTVVTRDVPDGGTVSPPRSIIRGPSGTDTRGEHDRKPPSDSSPADRAGK
ncbi:Serine acetyltransferase [Austwickia chelonae]|uniref:Serine acetyltransferase n=1 Tax=Austwickia chelonae NBRC 105200 TaxID=1184607 RepID=K6W4W6_9MICO|nr:serine acetyltransferase [Austwickia chelonae]GAB76867.1 serine acetyltransferase [Austwickia chelonae NBRC 105200]SEW31762.1 Serine acetyltransferase [Austwickia chelonae]